MLLLIFYLSLALGVSTLCSLVEASILSLKQSHIARLLKDGRRTGRMLEGMKKSIDRPLAAILTLNTIAHTVGAAGVGAEALVVFGHAYVAITSAILTILILVVSEIIPKTLGAVYAPRLATFTAYSIQGMIFLTYPLVYIFQKLSRFIGGGGHARLTRDEVALTAELGHSEGALDEGEAKVIMNLLRLNKINVDRIMTPRNVVYMLQKDMTVEEVMEKHPRLRFGRIPIYANGPDEIAGQVLRSRLYESFRDEKGKQQLKDIAHPIHALPETATVAQALNQFVQRREHLFHVVDEYGGTAGIVTLEDAIETLLGVEIVDETDLVEDMRKLALRLYPGKSSRNVPTEHQVGSEMEADRKATQDSKETL